MSLLDDVTRVVVLHAHPDDETLATGALLAHLSRNGVEVHVLTATRGERGGVVDGVPAAQPGTDAYAVQREQELAGALVSLGVHHHAFLGAPPARAEGQVPRTYEDSGMTWVTATLAGPAADAGPRALTSADSAEVAGDVAAYLSVVEPDLLMTYDATGGYGHPDHVRLHEVGRLAAQQAGVALVEFLPREDPHDPPTGDVERLDLVGEYPVVAAALAHHRTQLTVEGGDVVHQGGQREPVLLTATLRRVSTPGVS